MWGSYFVVNVSTLMEILRKLSMIYMITASDFYGFNDCYDYALSL